MNIILLIISLTLIVINGIYSFMYRNEWVGVWLLWNMFIILFLSATNIRLSGKKLVWWGLE